MITLYPNDDDGTFTEKDTDDVTWVGDSYTEPRITVCGDCGDEITLVAEGKYVHANDSTPMCRNRNDAKLRKPGYFAEG